MPQGHQRLSSLRRTGPFLRHYVCHKGIKGSAPYVEQVRSFVTSYATRASRAQLLTSNRSVPTSLRMPQGHHRLSSLRSNNAHTISIGIHCDLHGKDFSWRKCEGAVRTETAPSRATCIIATRKPQRDFLVSDHDTQSSILASPIYRPMACA